jgi:hypothetical protein
MSEEMFAEIAHLRADNAELQTLLGEAVVFLRRAYIHTEPDNKCLACQLVERIDRHLEEA